MPKILLKNVETEKPDTGLMMQKLIASIEFKYYRAQLSKLRDEAMYMVLSVDSESVRNRTRLMVLDEIMGIPELIIKKSKLDKYEESIDG